MGCCGEAASPGHSPPSTHSSRKCGPGQSLSAGSSPHCYRPNRGSWEAFSGGSSQRDTRDLGHSRGGKPQPSARRAQATSRLPAPPQPCESPPQPCRPSPPAQHDNAPSLWVDSAVVTMGPDTYGRVGKPGHREGPEDSRPPVRVQHGGSDQLPYGLGANGSGKERSSSDPVGSCCPTGSDPGSRRSWGRNSTGRTSLSRPWRPAEHPAEGKASQAQGH